MMHIKLNNYVITSDDNQFILNEIKIPKEGKSAGIETLSVIGYYPRLDYLINKLMIIDVRKSDVQSLSEINNRINALSNELSEKVKELL